jgi:putative ABC transport system permease protein
MPRIDSISVNYGVALFALLVAVATGVLCSLAPAYAALRTNLLKGASKKTRAPAAAVYAKAGSAPLSSSPKSPSPSCCSPHRCH